jgi:4-amino-4-deoxy-L-arabinose transferase-like glycosyltransferase
VATFKSGTRGFDHPELIFALVFAGIFLLHISLLRLPYFWDEAGYYVPAARDLLLSGSLIPHSTPSNAHPPLVMAYLAFCWKIAGYSPLVTRTAMLVITAFALTGLFQLAKRIRNPEVAIASTVCTALYPVFFAQSSLAHVDLAAAGLLFWGLLAYIEDRRSAAASWFSLAFLAKETAIVVPLALFAWESVCPWIASRNPVLCLHRRYARRSAFLLIPLIPLCAWYSYHYLRTGFVFGNPEFFRYNVQATMHPLRIGLALLLRLWQVFGYFSLYLLTLAAVFAMTRPPLPEPCDSQNRERARIAWNVQLAFLAITVIYVFVLSVVGGAVLARYMLPIVPLAIMLSVSTLRRRVRHWGFLAAMIGLVFVIDLFVNPPYGFSMEDNLAYRDYIVLHQNAEKFLEKRYPSARVLTAWPANDELTRPYLGYVDRPMQVLRIEDFTAEQLMSAAELRAKFNVALVFSTKYEPRHSLLEHWQTWMELKTRYFGYHRDVRPGVASQILGGHVVYSDNRDGQWIAVIEIDRIEEARN